MNKFCALSLGLLLCFTGCKDFKEFQKNQNSKAKEKISSKKSSLDDPNFWGLTNLETLGMTLDSTTRDQAIDILNSHGYALLLPELGILEKLGLAELYAKSLEKFFTKDLHSTELLSDGIKSLHDRLKTSSIILAVNIKFEGKWDNLNLVKDPDIMKNLMIFTFDENKKLIMFFKQYSENKEAELVTYEVMKNSAVGNREEKKSAVFRKDQSFAIIGKKDPEATSYTIFAPSIVGKHVDAFNKAGKSIINFKEFEELRKKEDEYVKNLEGVPRKEFRKKLEEFRNSEEYKKLRKKRGEKFRLEYLKNLEANR